MKRLLTVSILVLTLFVQLASAQQLYSHDKVEYTFELPSATWRAILEPDASHDNPEFVYGDRLDGYLTIRK